MSDIKTDFQKWLVENGVSERTSTGRRGAAYEYVRLLNKVCDFIYKKHDVYSARSFVDEFAKSNHLNSTQKNELEVLLKSKGAKF